MLQQHARQKKLKQKRVKKKKFSLLFFKNQTDTQKAHATAKRAGQKKTNL